MLSSFPRFMPLLAFILVLALFAVPTLRQKNPGLLPSALLGASAPDFRLPGFGGGPGLTGEDLKGTPSLVNFFSSWCTPCAAEQKTLADIARRENVKVYGIAYKDKKADLTAFLSRHGDPFSRIGFDADGRVAIDWGVYGVPETFVLDKDGIVRYRHAGPLTEADDKDILQPLLREMRQ